MFTISKQFEFSASHQLEGLPDDHPCSRLHGHNFVVEIEIRALYLNPVGFTVDYRDLAPIKALIDDELDHRHLNDVVPFNPTAESMAEWVYHRVDGMWPSIPNGSAASLAAVRFRETPKTCAEYRQ